MKQLIKEEPKELESQIGVSTSALENIIKKAKTCTDTLFHR